MDEYNTGMDPEVKLYFRKILKSFAVGGLWLLTIGNMAFAWGLAVVRNELRWYNMAFYAFVLLSLSLLIWFFYRVWRKSR